MNVYITLFAFLAFLGASTTARKASGLLIATIAVGLVLFMGTRYETGCDFHGYHVRFYRLYDNVSFAEIVGREEPAFHLMNWLVHSLDFGYVWVNLVASAIYIFCISRFIKLSHRPILLLALFFPILVVQLGMSGLRQALATGFLMLALVEFVSGNRLKTGIYILVGALFHQSLVVLLPLAMIAGHRVSLKRMMIALAILGPVAVWFLGDRAEVYSNRYIAQIYGENSASGALFRYALAVLPFLIFVAYRDIVQRLYPSTYDLIRLFALIAFVVLPLALYSTVALHRITFYLLPVSALTLIAVASVIFPKKDKQLATAFPIAVYGSYIVVWFSFSRHAKLCYLPYDTHLFH